MPWPWGWRSRTRRRSCRPRPSRGVRSQRSEGKFLAIIGVVAGIIGTDTPERRLETHMARGRHIKRARSVVVVVAIAVGIVLLALGGVSYAAYRYDRASSDQILPGVTVAGTDVGDMTRVEAIQAVQRAVQQRLTQPIIDSGRGWVVGHHARRARPVRRRRRRRRSSAPGVGLRGIHHAGLASSPRGARRHLGRRPARRRRDRRLGIWCRASPTTWPRRRGTPRSPSSTAR